MISMKKTLVQAAATLAVFTPAIALAQFGEINSFIGSINTFINNVLIPLVFAIALLVFIWGMFQFFIRGGHDPEAQQKGKDLMLWAVVGFVLMVSIFGIVNLIAGGLGFSGENIQNIPSVPTR